MPNVRYFARYLDGDEIPPGWTEWARENVLSLPDTPVVCVEWTGDGDPTLSEGRKDDSGKSKWSLIPHGTMTDVVAVLTDGGQRYGDDNWQRVPNARQRYYDAAMRHLDSFWHGEAIDPSSGRSHLAHVIANCLFLLWFQKNRKDE